MESRSIQLCLQVAFVLVALSAVAWADSHNDTVWCYNCNSGYDGSACAGENLGQLKPFLTNCGHHEPAFTRCRTMIQTVEGETRTIRSCATEGSNSDRCMDRVGTARVKVRYCECPGVLTAAGQSVDSACNEAGRVVTSLAALTSSVVLAAVAAAAARRA